MFGVTGVICILLILMYFHLKRLGYFDKKKEVKLKSKNSTGKQGELLVARKLKKLDNKKYIVINDMYLRSKSGKLTQIDHIVVSVYGLFVVEVKNFMGTVIGGEDDTVWTHLVGKRSWDFYNPLRQNDAHVKVIKGFLGVDAPLIPIVCFTDRTTLKVKTKSVVTNPDGLVEYIANHSKPLISESELSNIVAYLKKNEAKGEKVKQEHLEQINDKKKYYKNGKYVGESMGNIQDKVSKTKCPKCGSRLMLRTGNKGDFWGCDNFPTCKHTEQVK